MAGGEPGDRDERGSFVLDDVTQGRGAFALPIPSIPRLSGVLSDGVTGPTSFEGEAVYPTMVHNLDDIDRGILHLLQQNARGATAAEMADMVGT
ncbi:hypothetical protein C446_16707, partial [Halobiforma nitratireducens JCM 10879]